LIELDGESRILSYDRALREIMLCDGPSPKSQPLFEVGGTAANRSQRLWHRVIKADWRHACRVEVEAP
jgi:hypothetical protein